MAPRCTSFQRGCLLILNWKSCSGSEIFLIWSLSLMKYLCLSGLIISLFLIRLTYPSPLRSAGKTASGGRSFGPQTNILLSSGSCYCRVVYFKNQGLGEKNRRWEERNRRRRQTKTKKKKKYRNELHLSSNTQQQWIYQSHFPFSQQWSSLFRLFAWECAGHLTYCTPQPFYSIVLYMSRDRKRVKRKRQTQVRL